MKALSFLPAFAFTSALTAAELPAPKFRAVNVDTNVSIGYGLAIADVDGDGKPDILLADQKTIQWYQNPDWKKHVIAENLTPRDNVCIAARDVDGDGKCEIAVGGDWSPGDTLNSGAVFYLIPPADRTQKWTPVKLHHEPTVHRMHWAANPAGKWDLIVKPLHGRGNKNSQGDGGKVLAYTMPADVNTSWKTDVVSDFLHASHNFEPINSDKDPEHELLIGGKEGVWSFDRGAGSWEKRQFTDQPTGEVRDGVLPDGARFIATIEPMHGTTVALYRQPGAGGGLWTRQVLDDSLKDGHALAIADVLGIGSVQVIAGWRGMSPPAVPGVKLYTPLDTGGKNWHVDVLSSEEVAIEDMKAADLNGDGKPDLILAGRQTKNLRILFNERAK